MKTRGLRQLTAFLAGCVLVSSSATAQEQRTSGEDPALRSQMEAFVRARQVGDLAVLAQFHTAGQLQTMQDTLSKRYSNFRSRFPASEPAASDQDFRSFINDVFPGARDALIAALGRAFQHLSHAENRTAALEILALLYQFPREPWVVKNSSCSFARSEGNHFVYFLTEEWNSPNHESGVPRRFVVQWVNANGQWLLEDVSTYSVASSSIDNR